MTKALVDNHKKYLEKNFDPNRAEKEKQYLYSDLKHYGISTRKHHEFYKKHKNEIKSLNKKDVLQLVKKLWRHPVHSQRNFALHVLRIHKDKLNTSDMPLIEKLMRESKGWAFLDNLIIPLMPGIIKKDRRAYKYLKKWIKDDDFWVRRSALLAQVLFFRKNEGGDKELFFKLAESQFDEGWIDKLHPVRGPKATPETKLLNKRAKFFIRKAIGWSLREMSHKDPKSAYKFLRDNKSKMSGLSFRDGSRKLPEKMQDELKKLGT